MKQDNLNKDVLEEYIISYTSRTTNKTTKDCTN